MDFSYNKPQKLFLPGETININGIRGKVIAVGWLGERYYWLEQTGGVIAMIPAVELIEDENGGNLCQQIMD